MSQDQTLLETNSQSNNNQAQSIQSLFKNSTAIRIPAYQRAYSWEKKQCQQYLEDLKEQKGKKYYLGQLLFEKVGSTLYIIDGQQRLTTTVLFFSALVKALSTHNIDTSSIRESYLTDTFKTIEDDQFIFKKCAQKQMVSRMDDSETVSQRRIMDAYQHFERELSQLPQDELLLIKSALEDAVISTFFINNKVEAAQVFEYQNNRGKELSRFEIIKAFLMHQIYIHARDAAEADSIIKEVQTAVSKIYRNVEAFEGYFSENELLDYHCFLSYEMQQGTVDKVKDELKDEANLLRWIKDFFENFVYITSSAKSVVLKKHLPEVSSLFFVGNEVDWKLVLIVLFNKGEVEDDTLRKFLKYLEVLCFKLKLGDFRTDYLPGYSKNYYKDVWNAEKLLSAIKSAAEVGFKEYWNHNNNFRNIITKYFEENYNHYNRNTIRFVLWQYENRLRKQYNSGALLDKDLYDSYTIEHIKPQTPAEDSYTEDFKSYYLHKAGNLALLTSTQNIKFGNKSYEKKRELFQDTALTSYKEIRDKVDWTEVEIDERHQNILAFVKDYFNLEQV